MTTFKRIQDWANRNRGFIALIGAVLTGIGLFGPWIVQAISSFVNIAPQLVNFFRQYGIVAVWIGLFLVGIAFALVSLSHGRRLSAVEEKLQILETLPGILLDETASANLSNWSFGSDQWSLDQDGLSVTRSLFGGICKIGSTWENYELAFEFKIINKCAAWIVRAASDKHYVMIQCNTRQIRPHTLTVIKQPNEPPKLKFTVVTEIDHGLSLAEWNKVRTEVCGHGIKVWVGEKLVWSDSELLRQFPMGSVGFRCASDEHALFKSIRVVKR
jgi:hypothetical protein